MRTRGKTVIIVLAAILIGGAIGFLAEKIIKSTYRTKLEQTLDDLYLEGKPSIGAILIDPKSKHELYKTGNYYIGDILAYISGETDSEPLPSTTHLINIGGDYSYDLSGTLLELAQDKDYSFWTTKDDFKLTCLSKQGKVYEFSDIIIVASCFHQLNDKQVEVKRTVLPGIFNNQVSETSYFVDNSIYDVFMDYLKEKQFKGVSFYLDNPKNLSRRTKFSMLQEIRAKSIAKSGELFWGNKYCCLYPIESPIDGMVSRTASYKLNLYPAFVWSPVIHYAQTTIKYKIVFKPEPCKQLLWICLGGSVAICLLISVLLLVFTRKNTSRIK